METLIAIQERDGEPTVNARNLHAFLESRQDFSTWIKARIDQYGFAEGQDFTLHKFVDGRATVIDYHLGLDMAKEVAMVERTDRGKQARLYFIDCERRAKVAPALPDLSDPAALRTLLLDYTEKVLALEATVTAQAPKVAFAEAVGEAVGLQSISEVAKALGTGQKRLFAFLRDNGVLMVNNLPFQHHLDAARFKVVEKPWTDGEGATRLRLQTMVTGKGITFLQQRLARAQQQAEVQG